MTIHYEIMMRIARMHHDVMMVHDDAVIMVMMIMNHGDR